MPRQLAPPVQKTSRFENANRTRKLTQKNFSFFFMWETRIDLSIPAVEKKPDLATKKSHFPGRGDLPSSRPALAGASLRILTSGRTFLKHFDVRPRASLRVWNLFEAGQTRTSPASVHFPLHFLDFFDFPRFGSRALSKTGFFRFLH